MKVLSLFSGVGGFDLGLENAGMKTIYQCEWDKNANNILAHHWPNVPKWDDVSTLTGKYVLEHAPVIDVVAWGSPCHWNAVSMPAFSRPISNPPTPLKSDNTFIYAA